MNSACQSALEDVPIKEAKARIKGYFEEHHGEDLDYGDLREALCIALPTIVEACDQLEREGKIAGVD
jgi:DNA-binding MarR family transcriptional regulator